MAKLNYSQLAVTIKSITTQNLVQLECYQFEGVVTQLPYYFAF